MQGAGRLGMSEREFFATSPRFFFAALEGRDYEIEQQERRSYERARYIGFWAVAPHVPKSFKKPVDLGMFSWEKKTSSIITLEEREILEKEWDKWMQEIAAAQKHEV